MPRTASTQLTKRQQEILDYIGFQQRDIGVAPSTREIQKHFGFASQTAVMSHLQALETKKAIQRLPGKARAVILTDRFPQPGSRTDERWSIKEIPVYSNIPAGRGDVTEAEKIGSLAVDPASLGWPATTQACAIRVRGDSMIDAHIMEGDTVVLDKGREPRDGDVVAALIDGEITLKTYKIKRGLAYLKAENPRFPDLLPAQELVVQGVMIGLLRTHRK